MKQLFLLFWSMIRVRKIQFTGFYTYLHIQERLLDCIQDGIVMVSENGRIIYANQSACSIFPRIQKMKNVKKYRLLRQMLHKNKKKIHIHGSTYWVKVKILKRKKKVLGYILCFSDISQISSQTDEIRKLRRSIDVKNKFLANLSHEVRNPLHMILGLNEMMSRETAQEKIREYSGGISTSGKTLMLLFEDIIEFSKIDAGKLKLRVDAYQPEALFRDIWNTVCITMKKAEVDVRFAVDENIPGVLYGDAVRIKQILINLLSNAIKYTEKGSVTLKASYFLKKEDKGYLCCSIKDTGIGVSEENLRKIFNDFERGDAEKHLADGSGLGLFIVKTLITMMGGGIEAESVIGEGSNFTFYVPQRISAAGNEDSGINQIKYPFYTAPRARILVVDDFSINLQIIRHALKRTLIKIDTAFNGAECLRLLQEHVYHLVLLDARLSDMNGSDILKKIKGIPVIAITGDVQKDAREVYTAKGFAEYLPKPVNLQLLMEVIRKFLPEHLMQNTDSLGQKDMRIENQSDMNEKLEYLRVQGILVEKALYYSDDSPAFYLDLVKIFIKEWGEKKDEYSAYLEKGQQKLCGVIMHNLKNSARYVGAEELAHMAEMQEESCKNGNWDLVCGTAAELIEQWNKTIDVFLKAVK